MAPATYIIRSKGSKANPEGSEFEMCSDCDHHIKSTKTACPCDGACHPVAIEWKDYDKGKAKRAANKRPKKDQDPRRSYYNIH